LRKGLPNPWLQAIPEAFFREIRIGDENTRLLSGSPGELPKRSPIGVYDKEILCDQCEVKFGQVDDYGVLILLKRFHVLFLPIIIEERIVGYRAENINQDLLLRFLVSTLWRASVSTQPFYDSIDLGSFESLAKQTILNPNIPVPKQFKAMLWSWMPDVDSYIAKYTLMNPFYIKGRAKNTFRFYFGEVAADIIVDTKPILDNTRILYLLESPSVILAAREFTKSKDYATILHTVEQSNINVGEKHSNSRVKSDNDNNKKGKT
jgi:hypothetical protein